MPAATFVLLSIFFNAFHPILSRFFRTFFNGPIEKVKKTLFLPFHLYSTHVITKSDFQTEFIAFLKDAPLFLCDFPKLPEHLATIALDFISRKFLLFSNLWFDVAELLQKIDQFDRESFLEFYHQYCACIKGEILKLVNCPFPNLFHLASN